MITSQLLEINAEKKLCNLLLALTLLALLSACAVTSEQRAKLEPQAITLRPNQGIVIAKVTSNRFVSTYFTKWGALRIKNIATEETFDLNDNSAPYVLHSFHIASVPAGEYELLRLKSETHGAMSLYADANLGPKLGRFVVAEGGVTDLGTILYLRPYFPFENRQYRLLFSQIPQESEKLIEILSPTIIEAAKQKKILWVPSGTQWRTDGRPTQNFLSMFLNSPYKISDGSVFFGEAFGRIAQRSPSGRWTFINTSTVNTIHAVWLTANGTIVAGSEQGLLLAKSSNENLWSTVPFPLKDALISFIGEHSRLGYVTVAQDRRHIAVLATKDIFNPTWIELKRIPMELFSDSRLDTRFSALLIKDRLVVVTRSAQSSMKTELHDFNIDTAVWTTTPVNFSTSAIEGIEDGSIYSMAGPNISQSFYVSSDYGKSWEKRNSPNWMSQPVFRNAAEGYAIRVENIPAFNSENLTNSFWKTTDGGNTWLKIGSAPNLSSRLILLDQINHFLVATANGHLYLSRDSGVTWVLEGSVQQ